MREKSPYPQPSFDPDIVRILAIAAFGLLISIKADGRFPLPEALSEVTFQLLLLPYTLALIGITTAFLCADRLAEACKRVLPRRLLTVSPVACTLAVVVGFELLTFAILRAAASKYAAFGYALPLSALLGLALVVGGTLVLAAWGGRLDRLRIFAVAAVAYLATQVVSLVYFPLHPARSDMLPLITAAAHRLLLGASPYGFYDLPNSVPLTYLPGTWLPFVVVIALGQDPRIVQILTTLGAATLLVVIAPQPRRQTAAGLAALFLLTPYLQYRHDIYLGPLWLSLALVMYLHTRGHRRWLGIALGWAAATSQFVWVMLPVYGAQLWRRDGARRALRLITGACVTTLFVLAPFVALTPQEFAHGIFGHWNRTLSVTTANLGYFVVQFASIEGLRIVQAFAWLLAIVVAVRSLRATDTPWAAMAAVLGVFLLFNSLVWVYFYLTVLFLLVASAAAGERPRLH